MKRKWLEPSFISDLIQIIVAALAAIVLALDSTGLIGLPWLQDNLLNLIFVGICALIISSAIERRFAIKSLEERVDKRLEGVQQQLEQISNGLSGLVSADLLIKNRRDLPYIESLITDAKEVCFAGRSLNGLISANRTLFLKLAKQGCKFKFLVGDPASRSDVQVRADIEHSIGQLTQMAEEVPSKIEFRIAQARLHYSIMLIDRKTKQGNIQIEFYTYQTPAQYRPHLTLNATRDPKWYESYNEQFENLWRDGKVFSGIPH